MATPAQRTNTWILDEWYNQAVAGTQGDYVGISALYVWGSAEQGSLAQNDGGYPGAPKSSPAQIPGTNWQTEFYNAPRSGWHMIMAKTNGTLWAWGKGSDWGQLGLNTKNPSYRFSSPVQIPGTDWKIGGTTREASFAVKTDGSLWTWGAPNQGQLGQSTAYPSGLSSPMQVGTDTTWNYCWGGYESMIATKTDGTLWAWGRNAGGELGDNSQTSRSSPIQIGTKSNWTTASFSQYGCHGALNSDNELFVWGFGNDGQMGQNTPHNVDYSSPTQIPGSWSEFKGGTSVAFAKKTDGTIWTWGSNGGALGLNDTASRSSPTQVGTDTNWNRISGGSGGIATKTDGTLWTWGTNGSGALGQGQGPAQFGTRSSPIQVGTDTSWQNVGVHGASGARFANQIN